MTRIYLKRRPDGSPRLDGPAADLPTDARYIHRQAATWIARTYPDLGEEGATLLAYIEAVIDPSLPEGWGDLLGTFALPQRSGDRAALVQRRASWLQAQTVQAAGILGDALGKLLDASRLTEDELGN